MATTTQQFHELAVRMKRGSRGVERAANKIKQETVGAVAQNLIFATPVDTGKAVTNWQIAFYTPVFAEKPFAAVAGRHGSTADVNMIMAYNLVTKVLPFVKPGTPVYLSNVVDYILDLAAGKSDQAPPGWVQLAVQSGVATARLRTLSTGRFL